MILLKDKLKVSGFILLIILTIGIFSIGSLIAGLYAGMELGKTVELCDKIPEEKEIEYVGEINDFSDSNITPYLFIESKEALEGGVMMHDLNNTRVINGDTQEIRFTEKIHFRCSDEFGEVNVQTSFTDEGIKGTTTEGDKN